MRVVRLLGLASVLSACMLGTSPLVHHPNEPGNLDGYWGYNVVIQPARARITVQSTSYPSAPPVTHTLAANTGVGLPEFKDGAAYVTAVAFSPKFVLSVGVSERWTVLAELGWPRQGLSVAWFTRAEGRGGFRLGGGVIADILSRELLGWTGAAWLPALSGTLSGYLGAEAEVGRFHHIFEFPDELDGFAPWFEGDHIPTIRAHANLLRTELRLRLPLGICLRLRPGRQRSFSLAAIPYVTVVQGDPEITGCRSCDGSVAFDSLEQRLGIEFQYGVRF